MKPKAFIFFIFHWIHENFTEIVVAGVEGGEREPGAGPAEGPEGHSQGYIDHHQQIIQPPQLQQ